MVTTMSGGRTSLAIPSELEGEMTPAVRTFVEMQLRRIERLEARFGKTPQNSSLPPSSQHPHAKPAPPRQPSGKKRGGQPGHPKHEWALIPTEQCSEVLTLKPSSCRRCGDRLVGKDAEPRLLRAVQNGGVGRPQSRRATKFLSG